MRSTTLRPFAHSLWICNDRLYSDPGGDEDSDGLACRVLVADEFAIKESDNGADMESDAPNTIPCGLLELGIPHAATFVLFVLLMMTGTRHQKTGLKNHNDHNDHKNHNDHNDVDDQ